MNFYNPSPVHVEPDSVLRSWRVYELQLPGLPAATRHFVGYNLITGDGRVSSPIQSWDPVTRTGVTRSGRRYHLDDADPGFNLDAEAVFSAWLRVNRTGDVGPPHDVSVEYASNVRTSTQ